MGHFFGPPASVGIVSSGIFGVSPAGATGLWTAQSAPMFGVYGAAAAGGRVVCIDGSAQPFYSTDGGVTWTASGVFIGASTGVGGAVQGGVFVMFCDNGLTSQLFTSRSTDGGVSWSSPILLRNPGAGAAIVGNGGGILVALSSTNATPNYWTSADNAVSWTAHATFANTGWGNSQTQNTALFDGTSFIALAHAAGLVRVCSSLDGITWTVQSTFSTALVNPKSIAFGNGVYVLSLGDPTVAVAATAAGLSAATPTNTGLPGGIGVVFYDGVRFFAFDTAGNVASSLTGLSWTPETLNFSPGDNAEIVTVDTVNASVLAFAGVGAASLSTRAGL